MGQEQRKTTPEVQALLDAARQALQTGKRDSAAALYDQALAKARELQDRKGETEALRGRGNVHYLSGELSKALELYGQALPLYRTLGDRSGEAATLGNLGMVSSATGQPQKALEFYNQALPIHREIGNKPFEANTLTGIGVVYSSTGQPRKALEFLNQALALYRALRDKRGEAATLGNLGVVHTTLGEPQKALEFYQQALPLYREIGNRPFEANALGNLGIVYRSIGQMAKALEYYNQALPIHRALGDKNGEAGTLDSIGIVYYSTGQPQRALEFLHQALPLYQQTENRPFEANTLGNLGEVYSSTGQFQRALEFYNRALPLHRRSGNKVGEVNTLTNLGNVYRNTGQRAKALELYRQTLLLYRGIEDRRGEALALTNLGVVHEDAGQPQKALEFFNQAAPLYRAAESKQGEAEALGHLARTEEALHRPAQAEAHYARAVALNETLRANLGGLSDAKSSFLGSALPTYYGFLRLLLERGKTVAAFEIAQKTKARSLLDLMASGRVDIGAGLTAEERAQEQALRQRADFLNQRMVKESVQNEVGAKKRFAALQGELRQAESQLQTLTDTLYARHPGLAQRRVARTATLTEVAKLLPEGTALLEYIVVAQDRIALFVVARSGVAAVTIPVAYKALAAKASALRAACADPRRDYEAAAGELYKLLLAPAARHLAGVTRLVICPDGALWDIPFAALRGADGRFLAQRYEIAYAYSATGAQAALAAKAGRTKPTRTLLALANPDFGASKRFGDLEGLAGQRPLDAPSRPLDSPSRPLDSPSRPLDSPSRPLDSPSRPLDSPSRPLDSPSRAFDAVSRGGAIVSLPGTQREADALRRLFPGSAVLTGKAAQESAAKQLAGSFRYLHLATHGVFNDASPMLSSLVLAQPTDTEDGFLTAREIFDMDLSAEMVVLSACNTARGVQRTGDGIVGLTWALFAAGCPTQVVSQWSVDDASTATLMTRFYGTLAKGKSGKGAALRQASLSLLADSKHRHPYYWAPFVLMGDWR